MSAIAELFGRPSTRTGIDWARTVADQGCPFLGRTCYKVRKSEPEVSIGSCTVLHGKPRSPIMICPARLLEHRQIFSDCLHLLDLHERGNELHVVSEVSVPGGSVDYFLVSVRGTAIVDFVGIELQTLDTTGTIWPERQRLLHRLEVRVADGPSPSGKSFGMNWKHTAKTTLVQLHHKVETFEHIDRKLVLVLQDVLMDYMAREFDFRHLMRPAALRDAMHFHPYVMTGNRNGGYRLSPGSRFSTNAAGIERCLDLRADTRVELPEISSALRMRIGPATKLNLE